ncbi:MAG: metallopeptidase family protein [Alphaproteobacteria bacterium]|nr:metallopeptidase family protein [Alphaproteobacteria bacterium]
MGSQYPYPRRSGGRVSSARTDWALAPSLDDIRALAEQALASLPQEFRLLVGDVAIHVTEFPDEDTEREMELESPFDILGLYKGVSLAEKSSAATMQDVDRILLYRRPILDYWCEEGEELPHIVRHVLIHEIGHHFGLSDADMERIEEEA